MVWLPNMVKRRARLQASDARQVGRRVSIGTDHQGYHLKQVLLSTLTDWGYGVIDAGVFSQRRSDYPPIAFSVARAVAKQPQQIRGVLLCGSGIGMAIAANKVKGARAALVMNSQMATQAVEHDQANILVFPASYLNSRQVVHILKAFLKARPDIDTAHRRRVKQIHQFEQRNLK